MSMSVFSIWMGGPLEYEYVHMKSLKKIHINRLYLNSNPRFLRGFLWVLISYMKVHTFRGFCPFELHCGEQHYLVIVTRINSLTVCVKTCERRRRKSRREDIGIIVYGQSSPESCWTKTYSALPYCFNSMLPSNAHNSTPFFQKTVFFSKIFFSKPPSTSLEVCLIRNICDNEVQFTFLTVQGLKKAIFRRCRSYLHFAKLRHTEGFTNVNAFIQLCLTSTLFC